MQDHHQEQAADQHQNAGPTVKPVQPVHERLKGHAGAQDLYHPGEEGREDPQQGQSHHIQHHQSSDILVQVESPRHGVSNREGLDGFIRIFVHGVDPCVLVGQGVMVLPGGKVSVIVIV